MLYFFLFPLFFFPIILFNLLKNINQTLNNVKSIKKKKKIWPNIITTIKIQNYDSLTWKLLYTPCTSIMPKHSFERVHYLTAVYIWMIILVKNRSYSLYGLEVVHMRAVSGSDVVCAQLPRYGCTCKYSNVRVEQIDIC